MLQVLQIGNSCCKTGSSAALPDLCFLLKNLTSQKILRPGRGFVGIVLHAPGSFSMNKHRLCQNIFC
ncbi:hypothetical protein Spb1_09750 [Planctopirus ephydatiae]|uniref:Uncharacterized protein n=1 Tax=Planctopirus ephydatiae TaxID=2528019 RepID=A0A518GKP0_9PLAN|nr:hypothetical protein Spb1_09750 [Planctopirus ephydatiae]